MRTLAAPPASILDPEGAAQLGSYRGALPRVNLAEPAVLSRIIRHKRWIYAAIASGDLLVAAAVVKLGYVSKCFAFVMHKRAGRIIVDHSSLAPPFSAFVGDSAGEGCEARFRFGSLAVHLERLRGMSDYALEIRAPDLIVVARLGTAAAPSPISAVARLGDGLTSVTEKRALLSVEGEAVIQGERRSLDGGLGGLDYSQGNLPRHTLWRWAFALGRARSGEKVGLNLVEGFVGEAECAAWVDGELYPLGEGRFTFDGARPDAPWQVRTEDGSTDLELEVLGVHAERTNLGLVASRFIQTAGTFRGKLEIEGKGILELEDVLGVTEDQDALW
jgi:hypothetical protein